MSEPAPPTTVQSPNANKTVGSSIGGLGGAGLATLIVAILSAKYPDLSPTASAAVAGVLAAGLGAIGTFLAPLLTAAQNAAVRALDGHASADQKTVQKIAVAQAIVNAASTFPTQPSPAAPKS